MHKASTTKQVCMWEPPVSWQSQAPPFRLSAFDQTNRLHLDFQGVFAPGLAVFFLAHVESSKV